MTFIVVLKLALVPMLIGAVTLAGRRWGATVAGWLSAFPIVSGPILFFVALEQGAGFVARAALGTLSAVLAILVFAVSYAWAATRFGLAVCLAAAFVAYFTTVALLNVTPPVVWIVAPLVFAGLWVAPRLFPVLAPTASMPSSRGNDIYLRMFAGAILVYVVTRFSAALGPQLSGIFAMFPVMASVLVAFSHRHSGAEFAVNLLRGMVLGFYAFAAFCLVLALTLPAMGIAPAFVSALASAVVVQAGTRVYLRRVFLRRKASPSSDSVGEQSRV
jgi:hypothetical protein